METKKLNTRVLYGVGTGLAAFGALSWFLARRTGKHSAAERSTELETRTDIRCKILSDRIDDFHRRINESDDPDERVVLVDLISQANAKLVQIQEERALPSEVRLLLEEINEAEAELEELLNIHQDG